MARNPQPLTHRNQNPEYIQALEDIGKLEAARAAQQGRLLEIGILLQSAISAEEREDTHIEAAMHFVETGTVKRPQSSVTLGEDHMLLREQIEALTQAIDRKQRGIYELESRLSNEAMTRAKDDFKSIRERYVAKLRELDAIVVEEQQLLNDMNSQGYYPTLNNPVAWFLVGTLSDPQSAISSHLRGLSRA